MTSQDGSLLQRIATKADQPSASASRRPPQMVPSHGMVAPQRQFVTGAGYSENLDDGSPSVART